MCTSLQLEKFTPNTTMILHLASYLSQYLPSMRVGVVVLVPCIAGHFSFLQYLIQWFSTDGVAEMFTLTVHGKEYSDAKWSLVRF